MVQQLASEEPWCSTPGSQRSQWARAAAEIWCSRRTWQPTLMFLPENSTENPGRTQSTGLQRVRYNWSDAACMDAGYLLASGSSIPVGNMHRSSELLGSRDFGNAGYRSASSSCYRRHGIIRAFYTLWQSCFSQIKGGGDRYLVRGSQGSKCRDIDSLSHRSYSPIRGFSSLQQVLWKAFWLVLLCCSTCSGT